MHVPVSAKQVIKRLKREGFEWIRTQGSHQVLRRGEVTVVVPVHANRSLPLGTLKSIEKQSGVKLR